MLEEVASCSITSLAKPWLLAVGVVVLLASLATIGEGRSSWFAGLIVAAGFGVAYLVTRRQVVSVGSAAAPINIDIVGSDERKAHGLIDAIEAAKEARYRGAA